MLYLASGLVWNRERRVRAQAQRVECDRPRII